MYVISKGKLNGCGHVLRYVREESPSSIGQGCKVTPCGGNSRDSATESKPPAFAGKGETVR